MIEEGPQTEGANRLRRQTLLRTRGRKSQNRRLRDQLQEEGMFLEEDLLKPLRMKIERKWYVSC